MEDLPYRAALGVYGSWIGFILSILCIIATIYTACSPGEEFSITGFFQEILALPLVIICYIVWKVWKRPSVIKVSEADLISGRRELDLKHEKDLEETRRATWGPIKRYILFNEIDIRVYRFFC